MKVNFSDRALQEIYETSRTNDSRYKKLCRNKKLIDKYIQVVTIMALDSVISCDDLRKYSYLHYEKLKYQERDKSSVRIIPHEVYRLIFYEIDNGIEVELIEIDTTHYGNK